ncbi:DELTA-actitoxin-Afr1a-like [Arapaima gigas]
MFRVYNYSGHCYNPSQPTVRSGVMGTCLFGKLTDSNAGTMGVLMYDVAKDLEDILTHVAIMFSVPFDYNLHENWFALGFFGKDQACDKSLYKLMFYNNRGMFSRQKASGTENRYTHQNSRFIVRATMSLVSKPVMKVEFWDKGVISSC